jgi:hypothetical protein
MMKATPIEGEAGEVDILPHGDLSSTVAFIRLDARNYCPSSWPVYA